VIFIYNRRVSLEKIQHNHPQAIIIDLTSRSVQPWIRFSPFYPHGDIPVPFSPDYVSTSVEGVWQGLKVFEHADVDPSKFTVTTMKHLKRSTQVYGKVLGHRKGVDGDQLLPYIEARHFIYLPTYRWVLEHSLKDMLAELQHLEKHKTLIFLDYETNYDINVATKPLSHAGLVKLYLEGKWPQPQH
jgi:hypothetical protein